MWRMEIDDDGVDALSDCADWDGDEGNGDAYGKEDDSFMGMASWKKTIYADRECWW